jgi:hypothetical protein
MATYSKQLLSGSTYGQPITISNTSSTGNLIHATQVSSTAIDEIWLYATNQSSNPVTLTVQYGGTSSTQNAITIVIPATSGLTLVLPGLVLTGSGSLSSYIYAYAATTNVITVSGYVNRVQ